MPFTCLPEQLNFLKAVEPDALQRHVAAGSVEAEARAICFQRSSLRLTLRNAFSVPVPVLIERGTFFHSAEAWHTPLVVSATRFTTLSAGETRVVALDALSACAPFFCPAGHAMELSAYVLDSEEALASQSALWEHTRPFVPAVPSATVAAIHGQRASSTRLSAASIGRVAEEEELDPEFERAVTDGAAAEAARKRERDPKVAAELLQALSLARAEAVIVRARAAGASVPAPAPGRGANGGVALPPHGKSAAAAALNAAGGRHAGSCEPAAARHSPRPATAHAAAALAASATQAIMAADQSHAGGSPASAPANSPPGTDQGMAPTRAPSATGMACSSTAWAVPLPATSAASAADLLREAERRLRIEADDAAVRARDALAAAQAAEGTWHLMVAARAVAEGADERSDWRAAMAGGRTSPVVGTPVGETLLPGRALLPAASPVCAAAAGGATSVANVPAARCQPTSALVVKVA